VIPLRGGHVRIEKRKLIGDPSVEQEKTQKG
jgi:hypothetical protein